MIASAPAEEARLWIKIWMYQGRNHLDIGHFPVKDGKQTTWAAWQHFVD